MQVSKGTEVSTSLRWQLTLLLKSRSDKGLCLIIEFSKVVFREDVAQLHDLGLVQIIRFKCLELVAVFRISILKASESQVQAVINRLCLGSAVKVNK